MNPIHSRWPWSAFAVVLLINPVHAALTTYRPALGLSDPAFRAISVTGTDFGTPQAGSSLTLSGTTTAIVPSTDREILLWTADQIVVKVPPAAPPTSIAVTVGGTTAPAVPIEYYVYDWFETSYPPDPGNNASPLAIAVDKKSRLWLTEEFRYYAFKMIDLRTGALTRYESPSPPHPAGVFCGGARSIVGEDIIVDAKGRVWAPEDSWPFCDSATNPNHGRILMFDPRYPTDLTNPRVVSVPGNQNAINGVAYDKRRRRVWFAQRSGALPARLGSFDPLITQQSTDNRTACPWPGSGDFPTAGISCDQRCTNDPEHSCGTVNDCQFCRPDGTCSDPAGRTCTSDADCRGVCNVLLATCSNGTGVGPFKLCGTDTQCVADPDIACGSCSNDTDRACKSVHDCALMEHLCAQPTDDQRQCVAEYREPDRHSFWPGHITVDRRGVVWYTNYHTANDIRRFDPTTNRWSTFNLPTPSPPLNTLSQLGSWPWQIIATKTGDIVFTAFATGGVGRIPAAKLKDPDTNCVNPFIGYDIFGQSIFGPNTCVELRTVPGAPVSVHSVTVDRRNNLWFGTNAGRDDPGAVGSLGYFNRDFTQVVLLPPLSLIPFVGQGTCGRPGGFVSFGAAGVAYDRRSQAILAADYCRRRVVRLRPEGAI